MKRIVVTGGSGKAGRATVRELLERGSDSVAHRLFVVVHFIVPFRRQTKM